MRKIIFIALLPVFGLACVDKGAVETKVDAYLASPQVTQAVSGQVESVWKAQVDTKLDTKVDAAVAKAEVNWNNEFDTKFDARFETRFMVKMTEIKSHQTGDVKVNQKDKGISTVIGDIEGGTLVNVIFTGMIGASVITLIIALWKSGALVKWFAGKTAAAVVAVGQGAASVSRGIRNAASRKKALRKRLGK